MTRDEALALYSPIRAAIQRILSAATKACSNADVKRAAKQLRVWSDGRIEIPSESALGMVADLALFEPNQRSKRSYDRFLRSQAQGLEAGDLPVALRLAGARFSVFRVLRRHQLAGVWADDLISVGEPIWILDQGLEISAPDGLEFGLRIFDAGDFHAGFGIVVPADPEITVFCAQASSRGNRLPVRHSLAATLYSDAIWDEWMRIEDEDRSATRRDVERIS